MGHLRFRVSIRAPTGRYVAPGGGSRSREPRHHGGAWYSIYRPLALPGEPHSTPWSPLAKRQRRRHRSQPALSTTASVRPCNHPVLLRRTHLERRSFRETPFTRREIRPSSGERFFRRAHLATAHAYRHRWRDLRPSSPIRRHGTSLCPPIHRKAESRQTHQLCGIPGKAHPRPSRRDLRIQFVELRPRGRALEK